MKLLLALAVLVAASPATAKSLTCRIVRKEQCSAERPCLAVDASKVFARVDLKARRYERCDRLGCDAYTPAISTSGVWTNISLPANGLLARVDRQGNFVEVATLGSDVLVSHGRCR